MKVKKLDDTIYQMDYILCCLTAYRGIIETGRDCNGCAAAAACKYRPDPGRQIRYNCPHYVEPKTEQNDSITCTNDSEKPNTSADHIAEADNMEPFARDHENDLISRQAAVVALKEAYWDRIIQSAKDDPCIVDAMTDWAIRQIKALPSAQQQYEPVTAEEFAKIMSGYSVYSFMAWRHETITLMNEMGFVICKKTM